MQTELENIHQLIQTGVKANIYLAFELADAMDLETEPSFREWVDLVLLLNEEQELEDSPQDLIVELFESPYVDLSYRDLSRVPSVIQRISNLRGLNLEGNPIECLDDWLFEFRYLEYLNLSCKGPLTNPTKLQIKKCNLGLWKRENSQKKRNSRYCERPRCMELR